MSTTIFFACRTAQAACLAVAIALAGGFDLAHGAEPLLEFNRHIRPILFDNCIACHGPDSVARQADLRLDRRESAVEMAAIAPGDPEASEMIRRILSEDEAEQMPPPESKKKLTAEQKEMLVRWIREGAEYERHWSLKAPVRAELPEVENSAWVRNAIDHFVARRLEEAGLSPAEEADRRTLARRLSLDLVGLPPSPEMVEAFVNDSSEGAYERLVDEFMASPQWGEHRGRYWLDAARYGDTHGIHTDSYREIWSYRDLVIDAFNANMPFDQFTVENLAGDLLPNSTLSQQISSGFNRCNITSNEAGMIADEYLVLYTRDRTETTSQVWMGLTVGCAVCHDHKFDPLSQKEFYELSAFFNNTTQKAGDGNISRTPPVVTVPPEKDRARWEELASLVPEMKQRVEERTKTARGEFDAWLEVAKVEDFDAKVPQTNLDFFAPLSGGGDVLTYIVRGKKAHVPRAKTVEWREGRLGAQAAYLNQGQALAVADAGDFEGDQSFSYAMWVKLPANDSSGALLARMDDGGDHRGWDLWVESRLIGVHIIHKWPDNALKVFTRERLPGNAWTHVAITYDGSREAAGVTIFVNGRRMATNVFVDSLSETTRTDVPLKIGQRNQSAPLSGVTLEDVRVYSRQLSEREVSSLASAALVKVIASATEQRDPKEVDALYEWWLANLDEQYQKFAPEYEALAREQAEIKARGTVAYVMKERDTPAMAYILNRGQYDQRGEKVTPGTPAMLPPFPDDLPRNRLGFAKWLMRPEHPLTARVTVNRYWQQLFGTGLVKTAGDFGVTGELPSHPDLLDWLAVEFRESGWDVKHMFKLMVMSATYRQSARITPEKLDQDLENRLLSRGPRFRMDAEMIRDYALAASGLLSKKIGGPSVRPYQPPGIWEAVSMPQSDTRFYKQDSGDSLYRRSMYTLWKRSVPPASMDIFNAPSREHCVVVRERTNTPLQALVTLNDPQFVEAARRLAALAMHAEKDENERINFIAERLLARPLRKEELAIVRDSLEELKSQIELDGEAAHLLIDVGDSEYDKSLPPVEFAAWTMVTNELMNLDEVLNK